MNRPLCYPTIFRFAAALVGHRLDIRHHERNEAILVLKIRERRGLKKITIRR